MTYYNDNDAKAVARLTELSEAGHISSGRIDARGLADVRPADLAGHERAHFFAGIGGWDYALRLAGWPAGREVWTGSCPCPPFSSAGRKKCKRCGSTGLRFFAGADSCIEEFGCESCGWRDTRHLWPEFYRLIRECRPATCFGEQVSSPLAVEWFAGIRLDLARIGYAAAAFDLPAASVGAPHIRQRLWWVADTDGERRDGEQVRLRGRGSQQARAEAPGGGCSRPVADAGRPGDERGVRPGEASGATGEAQGEARQRERSGADAWGGGGAGGVGNANAAGREGPGLPGCGRSGQRPAGPAGDRYWSDSVLIPCGDNKARRIKPGLEPLAHGVSGRVALLRSYGNAIVPQVAATFVRAYQSMETDTHVSS